MRRFLMPIAVLTTLLTSLLVCLVGNAVALETATDQGQIAYRGGKNLYMINADGTGRKLLIAGIDTWWSFGWSPDGSQLAFTRPDRGIFLATANGTKVRPLVGGRFDDAGDSAWSPDGQQIAFAAGTTGARAIFTIHSNRTGLRRLTAYGRNYYPDWSPDGHWILFERNRSGGYSELMLIRPNGSGLRRIATITTGKQCLCADWSPDGSKISYQATASPSSSYPDIFVMNADGTEQAQLTRHRSRDENPDWSPDGTRIAFYSERAGNGEIYVVDVDGTHITRVTHDPWYDALPRWRPTGNSPALP